MKTKLTTSILFCFIFLFHFSNGQSIVEEGHQWNTASYEINGVVNNSAYRLEGDTLIDDIFYKKMWHTNENPINATWNLYGYLREDSTKKVYLKRLTITEEDLVYDFGLSEGESLINITV